MKTAAAYIRVSTEEQTEYSPESQLRAIREYARRGGYILPEKYIFMDEGISGKTADKRPSFMRMIGEAKKNPKPFDAILLWKFSRFARSREDSIVYKSMLRKQLGIEVISVSENIGDDKMAVLIEAMIEAMDEYYSINLAEEVRRGMSEKAKRGEPLSHPPFGYIMKNKSLVPEAEESAVIKQVFEWYSSGAGMLRIAKNLNAAGVRTKMGNLIENRTVEYWLTNPVYIGKIRWTQSGSENSVILSDGAHEPLIDKKLWDSVQRRMAEQKEKYRKWYKRHDSISHWLAGLLRCGECGGAMVNCGGYFYCSNKNRGTCQGNGGIKAGAAEKFILECLRSLLCFEIETDLTVSSKTDSSSDVYERQLRRAQNRLRRVKESYENGIDTIEEYRSNKQRIQSEIDSILSQINGKKQSEHNKKKDKRIKNTLSLLEDPSVPQIRKNAAAREFISEIVKTGKGADSLRIICRP